MNNAETDERGSGATGVMWPLRWLQKWRERRTAMAWFKQWREANPVQAAHLRHAIDRGGADFRTAFLMMLGSTDAMQAFREAIEEGRTAPAAMLHACRRIKAT